MVDCYKVALFDLDGVVFNTEPQYTIFWSKVFQKYYPENPLLASKIKGSTLQQIFDLYFTGKEEQQKEITAELDKFERNMSFDYIPGFLDFVHDLQKNGIKTAVVTSSNKEKMQNVYDKHPEFKLLFNKILTSEDFAKSKPDPDCYLKGASYFKVEPKECIGFEDSFNGLKAVRAALMPVIGLATTNSEEAIRSYSDVILKDYQGLTMEKLCHKINRYQ
ncbi:MAG TPA: phosphatase [Prevotella sp.]|nr:phosphatase [Prevotella sp.]